ncbi:MAG TPA: hypothetical protein VE823_10150 [Geodermatophilus sp.]|nr:hypothetical protein [Geodermatophilus sp.]
MTSLQQSPAGLPGAGRYPLRPATPAEPVTARALVPDVPAPDRTGSATASRAGAG